LTGDGREIDLVIESKEGLVPIEIKMADKVVPPDAKHLRNLEDILDRPIMHSLVISNGPRIQQFDRHIHALPASWFLGGPQQHSCQVKTAE